MLKSENYEPKNITDSFNFSSLYIRKRNSIFEKIIHLNLLDGPVKIGRHETCNIVLESEKVSKFHAEIFLKDKKIIIKDLNSKNGTIIGCRKVKEDILLNGDVLIIGDFILSFRIASIHERIIDKILDNKIFKEKSETTQSALAEKKTAEIKILEKLSHLEKKVVSKIYPGAVPAEGLMLIDEFDDIRGNIKNIIDSQENILSEREQILKLTEISRVINTITDMKTLTISVLKSMLIMFNGENSFIMINDNKKMVPLLGMTRGNTTISPEDFKISTSIAMKAAESRSPILTLNAADDPRFMKNQSIMCHGIKQVLCAPMVYNNKSEGIIYVENSHSVSPAFSKFHKDLIEVLANQSAVALVNARLYNRINKLYLSTIETLATALEFKDPYTRGHSKRVQTYSNAIANEMGLDKKTIEALLYASLLHDIGKIGIEDKILNKNQKLDDLEYQKIRLHVSMGAEMIEPIKLLLDKVPAVRHHHERWDGKGYPDGLAGTDIPLEARIIAVADTFDAMTSKRPYRDALSLEEAKKEIINNSGTQFDPVIVEIFEKICDKKFLELMNTEKKENINLATENDIELI
jgi:putative nucleotidyltransferase with HDIG domain